MSRTRQWTAVGIVGVLALALGGLLWRSRNTAAPTTPSSTTLFAAPTTTMPTTTLTTVADSPTTTTAEQRLAEVEAILENLWFGWFDAIYQKDQTALWNVVATTPYYEAGVAAMDELVFERPPSENDISLYGTNLLLDRDDCLVAHYTIDLGGVVDEPPAEFVSVMWPDQRYGFRFATQWLYPEDMWLADCDEVVREVTP